MFRMNRRQCVGAFGYRQVTPLAVPPSCDSEVAVMVVHLDATPAASILRKHTPAQDVQAGAGH